VANTIPQTTGLSNASIADVIQGDVTTTNNFYQLVHRNCISSPAPDTNCITAASGSLFNCASLLSMSPSVSGVKLTTVFPSVDGATGDAAIATLLQAR